MHTVEEALAIVDAFLAAKWSEADGTNAVSTSSPNTNTPTSRRRCPAPRLANARGPYPAPAGPAASAPVRPRPVFVSSPQGRFEAGAATVSGRVLKKATAWGKHLFHHYEGGRVVHVHLGLYGTFTEIQFRCRCPSGRSGCGCSAPSTAPTCAGRRSAR